MKRKMVARMLTAVMAVTLAACGAKPDAAADGSGASGNDNASADTSQQEKQEDAGSGASGGEEITIEYFNQKTEEAAQAAYAKVVPMFEEEYPNIHIEINTVPDGKQVLTTRLASDDVPVMFTDYPTSVVFKDRIEGGYYMDLTDQEFMSNVKPAMLDLSVAPDGHYYAMPYSQNFIAVYYSVETFERLNIEVPKTWDEFIGACETIKAAGELPLSLSYKEPWVAGHMFNAANIALNDGGIEHLVDVIADTSGETKVSDFAGYRNLAEKVIQLMDYCNEDVFGIPTNQALEDFMNGKAAMTITGSYSRGTMMATNPDMEFGLFPLPGETEESTKIIAGVDAAICISGKASPEEQDAALKFLEFLSRPEIAQIWSDTEGAPSCIDQTTYGDAGVQPVLDMVAAGKVHDWQGSFVDSRYGNEIQNYVQQLLMDKDVDAFLDNVDAAVASLRDQG